MERIFVIPAPGLRVHLSNGALAPVEGCWTDNDMLVARCVRDGDLTIADPQPQPLAESPAADAVAEPRGRRAAPAADPIVTSIA